jgi:hypothetical protein
LKKEYLNTLNSLLPYKNYQLQHTALQEVFGSVTKLKKTNISHLLTLDFKNFPT